MPDQNVGPVQLPDSRFETWLIRFDEKGDCVSPQNRVALIDRLGAIGSTSVIIFSHGWNNDFSAATGLYALVQRRLAAHLDAYPMAASPPIFVGVLWPSTWFASEAGPALAGGGNGGAAREELVAGLIEPAARSRLDALLDMPAVAGDEARELSDLVASSLRRSSSAGDREGGEEAVPDAASVMAALGAMQALDPAPGGGGGLGQGGTVDDTTPASPHSAGMLDWLDPRNAIRLASVYQMKDRAGIVGGNGVAKLLEDILRHASGKVVCAGHSFGAKVVLSAVAGIAGPNKPHGVLLLQPAISYLCFAETIPGRGGHGGYFRVPAKVSRAILTTFSLHDQPLHEAFHLILRRHDDPGELRIAGGQTTAGDPPSIFAALGGYGPREAGQTLREPLPAPGKIVLVPTGPGIIGFDGSMGLQIASHGDVATPETAWLLYRLLAD